MVTKLTPTLSFMPFLPFLSFGFGLNQPSIDTAERMPGPVKFKLNFEFNYKFNSQLISSDGLVTCILLLRGAPF